jgi:hypothetical protein
LVLIYLLVLFSLVVAEDKFASWDEAIIDGGLVFRFSPFLDEGE